MRLKKTFNSLMDIVRIKCLVQGARSTDQQASSVPLMNAGGHEDQNDESESEDSAIGFIDPDVQRWHDFLDHLSGLCCFGNAGDQVTAIAARRQSSLSTVFVLATNNNSTSEPAEHLQGILALLNTVCHDPATSERTIGQIRNLSILQARKKVRNYRKRLSNLIEQVMADAKVKQINDDSQPTTDAQDHSKLHTSLTVLTIPEEACDQLQFCTLVSKFHQSNEYRILRDQRLQSISAYSRMRHYIGRLCYWERAATFVVRSARRYRTLLATAEVDWIDCTPGPRKCNTLRFDGNLRSLVGSIYPQFAADPGHSNYIVRRLESATGLLRKFTDKGQKPGVHAETALAHHFWLSDYIFAGPFPGAEDRYIGCSKPSCYCCSWYLYHHPGRFANRPSHGTAWFRWYPPVVQDRDETEMAMTSRILENMSNSMHLDVKDAILHNEFGRRRDFDSMTGTSG
ncbi:hypothetical protein AC578_10096 [Pseudocercospora eumusae]|uniref:Uncharacterized protein n=1 Tax=Pseudocercospora eumusae TaxID=321146 RepID=A0A139GVK7_9PEZI|nr:hypothetical protein AC578_10096 [Pseudocercospora eumusae]